MDLSLSQRIRCNRVTTSFTGILDTISGATVAYSVRRLSSTYTGKLLRVRESGGDTELDIGYLSNGDLDTVAMEAHCGANDGFVVTFYDQSGNGDDITEATASEQPQIVSSGSTILRNLRATLRFDGTDDSLQNASIAAIEQPEHCYCVLTQIAWVANRTVFDGNDNRRMALRQKSGAEPAMEMHAGLVGPETDPDLAVGTLGLMEAIFDGASSTLRTNNNSAVSGDAGTADGGGVTLGARGNLTSHGNADISEFILYLSTPSSASDLRTDIIDYFGI